MQGITLFFIFYAKHICNGDVTPPGKVCQSIINSAVYTFNVSAMKHVIKTYEHTMYNVYTITTYYYMYTAYYIFLYFIVSVTNSYITCTYDRKGVSHINTVNLQVDKDKLIILGCPRFVNTQCIRVNRGSIHTNFALFFAVVCTISVITSLERCIYHVYEFSNLVVYSIRSCKDIFIHFVIECSSMYHRVRLTWERCIYTYVNVQITHE